MKSSNEKFPTPEQLEREIGSFLTKRFGDRVKFVSPVVMASEVESEDVRRDDRSDDAIDFDLKPEALIAYLDQYIIQQDRAKAILATKICTHFNRIRLERQNHGQWGDMVGRIKNNVLMIGSTGVGKTYMIRLIAKKLGVPFVKGDATKFSETGYVGGDVEDLVRDLVREADDDIPRAECGIIYIDEIDKIASSRNFLGADVSRTGVQRALLKPLEETEVELKVPHDPISMMQEIEHFRKTGNRDRRTVNTRNILFIVSGAFNGLSDIVKKRLNRNRIGFSAAMTTADEDARILEHLQSEDLVHYGFESEFIGRLPVRAVFDPLDDQDLYEILKNPNNPVILGKRLDFAAYGIDIRFDDATLRHLAQQAALENTGARGLVSAVEAALLPFETHLPSMGVTCFAVTPEALKQPDQRLVALADPSQAETESVRHRTLMAREEEALGDYLTEHRQRFDLKYGMVLTPGRIRLVAACYVRQCLDVAGAITRVKTLCDDVKQMEMAFLKSSDINIVLEQEAVDAIVESLIVEGRTIADVQRALFDDFELGLKLIHEKTGRQRFFISRSALAAPETYISEMIRTFMQPKHDAAP
jgi:endopeptidase Clp ATP-binding regulatory subunit ClpX